MARQSGWLVGICGLALVALLTTEAQAQKKQVKPSKQWTGSVADETLEKAAPAVITSAKGLAQLWKNWNLEGKVPDVDFTKEVVITATTRGSKLNLSAVLDAKGNLVPLGIATRDLRPGFRYVLAAVSRDGVKTVNGKELPKE